MRAYLMKMFGISLALTIGIELIPAYILLEIRGEKRRKTGTAGSGRMRESERAGNGEAQETGTAGRGKPQKWPWLVILTNLLTNPPAVLLCWLGSMYLPSIPRMLIQIPVEVAVVAVEACIYRSFSAKPGWGIGRPVLLSAAANMCSWTTGILIMRLPS